MAASISLKGAKISAKFMQRTGEYLAGAAGDYIKDVTPNISSILGDAKSEVAHVSSTFKNSASLIRDKSKALRNQGGLKRILNWYINNGENDNSAYDSNLSFDIETDDASDIAEIQIGESEKNAKKIANAVFSSNQKLLEGQMELSANMSATLDKQTAVISAGFDNVNATLNKILEVVTKNTSTMIEATVAANGADKSFVDGKFNLSAYKNQISKNLKNANPGMGMVMSMIPMLTSGVKLSPKDLTSMAFGMLMDNNGKVSKVKENVKALDQAVNDVIMQSLIRLGENKNSKFAKIFGIDGSRKEHEGGRSNLELKARPFDSIAHEAITNAIPGYLQRILVQLGGPNLKYDYRSRSFKSSNDIRRELNSVSVGNNYIRGTSSNMQKAFGTDQYGQMLYNLLLTDIGSKYGNGGMPASFDGYIENLLTSHGVRLTAEDRKRIKMVSGNLSRKDIRNELKSNAASNNVQRNQRVSEWLNNADKYNIDTSKLKTSVEADLLHILEENGQISTLSKSKNRQFDAGVNYTNKALYAIHNLLNRGINVYQVGASNIQKDAFKKVKLIAPKGYITERLEDPTREKRHSRVRPNSNLSNASALGPEAELPEDEQLQGGKNWGGWAKGKGKALGNAILHGSSDDVRSVIMSAYGDVADLGAKALKDGAKKINDSFGNVSGFIKHKLFGTGYSYEENGKTVTVKDNEAGGVFGFMKTQISGMFSNSKKAVGNWFNSVKGYFDYGDDKSKEGKSVADKRKKLLSTSVGALAGAGLLGGPIGLIMGGLAGSALSGTEGIGKKIHDLFIGRDEGKAKGLLTRLADGVVDPIKYQFQKTAHHLGEHLKKNFLGPLSDIGLAIKDRIKNAASTAFGKVFGFIGKALLAPFKAVTKIAKAPINLIGGLARGGISAAGNVTGAGLNGIASMLAVSDEAKEQLKSRRAERKADFKENDKFDDFKTWQVGERERRAKRISDLKNATAEDIAIEEVKNTEDIKDKLEDIKDILSNGGIKGSKKNKSKSVASDTDTSSAITTAAVIATEGNLTSEDSREFNSILSESEKEKPSKGFIRNKLNKLFRSQEKDKEKTEEKKNTLWDWIKNAVSSVGGFLSGILGHLPAIAATLTALWALFGGGSATKFFGNLKDTIWNIFFGKDRDGTEQEGSIGAQGIDAATGLIDIDSKGKPILGWLPFTNLYHNKNDANGNYIKNVAATKAKNAVYVNSVLGAGTKLGWKTLKNIKAANAVDAAALTGNAEALHASQQAYYDSLWGEGGLSDAQANFKNKTTSSLGNVGKMASGMAVTAALGTATGFGVRKLSKYIMQRSGIDGDRAETMSNVLGNASGRLVGVAGVASMMKEQTVGRVTGNKGFVTKIVEALEKGAKWMGGKLTKKFPNAASKVSSVFNKAISKISAAGSKLAEKLAAKVSQVTGKSVTAQSLGAITLGILPAVLGIAGGLKGAFFPEHLFAVASGDADALMRTLSSLWNAMMGALSALPGAGVVVALWDIVDMVVAGLGIFDGLTLSQFLMRSLYGLIAGDDKLQEKTATFDRSLARYNEEHGTNLDAGTYNDMMNNTGFFDRIWNGKKSKRITGEDGQEYIVQNDDPYAGLKGKFRWIGDKITGKKRVKTANGSTSTISESKSGRKHGGSGGKLSPSSTISSRESSSGGLYDKEWTRAAGNDKRSLDNANGKISKFQKKGDLDSILNTKINTSEKDPLKDYYQASLDISKMYSGITSLIASTGEGVLANTSASKTKLQKNLRTSSRSFSLIGGPIGGPTSSANLKDGGTNEKKVDTDNYKKTTGKDYPGSYKAPTIGYPLEKNKFNITSPFGYRTAPYAGQHYGIDMVPTSSSVNTKGSGRKDAHTAEESGGGSWELKSIVNGEILDVKNNVDNGNRTFFINGAWSYQGANADSSGNMVAIKDSASGHILKYMHLKHGSIPSSIRRGQKIKKGSKIGIIGSTGFSTGPHLHYQVEDRAGHPIDPELTFPKEKKTLEKKQSGGSNVHNSTSGSFDENVDYTYDADGNVVEISDVSSEEDKGILGNLIDLLGNVGKQFLSMISGGLISFDQDSNSVTATSAQSFVDMCAREIGTAESPAGSNNVKYNTWYYGKSVSGGSYPWCCVFVQWCFNKAGIPLPVKTASCVSLYEYYKQNDPGRIHKSNPKPGDIFVYIYSNGTNGHVGIVKSGSGSSFTTIEGNCGDKVASKVRYTNDASFVCFISPVDFGTISAIADGNYSADIGSDMGSMWKFLKDLGYSDAGVAGILGCWQAESGGNSRKIEWDSSSTFQKYGGYDMVNNPANMDAFTKELFNHYASKGMSINRDAYKENDRS